MSFFYSFCLRVLALAVRHNFNEPISVLETTGPRVVDWAIGNNAEGVVQLADEPGPAFLLDKIGRWVEWSSTIY